MPNRNYEKGRRKEYKVCKSFREKGCIISQRSAGSHSPIDVFAIDKSKKTIYFIQVKPDEYDKSKAKKIKEELKYLNGVWNVQFLLI